MNQSKISVRYAKALFQHAIELGKLEDTKKDIELVFKTCTDVPEFNLYMLSPITKVSEKKKLAQSVFGNYVGKETMAFIELMIKNRRESHITNSTRNFLHLYKKHSGIKSVELITAQAIDNNFKASIIKAVETSMNSKVDLTEKIDSSILGGFVLRVEDQQYDASVSNKLKQMKKVLLEKI